MITKKLIYALSIVLLTSGMFAAQQLPKTATGFNKGLSLAQEAIQAGNLNEARDYINQLKNINPRSNEVSRLEAALVNAQASAETTTTMRNTKKIEAEMQELIEKNNQGALERQELEDTLRTITQQMIQDADDANKNLESYLRLSTGLKNEIIKLQGDFAALKKRFDDQTIALNNAEKELKENKQKFENAAKAAQNTTRFANAFTKTFINGYEIDKSGLRGLPEELNDLNKIINAQLLLNQTFKLMWDKAINNSLKRNWLAVTQDGLGLKLKGLISTGVLTAVPEE